MGLWGWGRYVPVAERRAMARREMDKLRRQGKDIQPVNLDGRTIARSFWGKGWCDHLESFSDYANRLPRGRNYVRNGAVCHLDVRPGRIDAIVSGSELYHVVLRIKELPAAPWTAIKNRCAGHIGSMLELLQGKLSDQVMAIVTNRQYGLFPQPGQMTFDCSCPDWAVMCKHVAAVLYGVGNRLDSRPDLLFLLRDVDAQELITAEMALPAVSMPSETLAADQLGAIFGIELDTASAAPSAPPTLPKQQPRTNRRGVSTTRRHPASAERHRKTTPAARPAGRAPQAARTVTRRKRSPQPTPTTMRTSNQATTSTLPKKRPTGQSVARLRRQQGLSVAQFAAQLGVSSATVYRWEATPGPLNLQAGPLHALVAWQQQAKHQRRGSNPGHS